MIKSLKFTWLAPIHDYTDPVLIVDETFTLAGITVAQGFKTDGTSLPRIIRWLFSVIGRYLPAAIVHDFCLKNYPDIASHKFRIALEEQKVSVMVRWFFYIAVKIYSAFKGFLRIK